MNTVKIEEQLKKDGYILEQTVGTSMQPMLRQRSEQLVIEKITDSPKKNDVVLFKRENGQYVLHRIIKKRGDIYIIRGDNCYGNETVSPCQLLGVLKGYYKNEKYIDCQINIKYKLYVIFWRISYPFRYAFKKTAQFARRSISRVRRNER